MRDIKLNKVNAQRSAYLSCRSTHRVYPQRVGRSQQSGRLKGLSIPLRPLSISSRGVESVLRALGLPSITLLPVEMRR